MKLNDKFEIIKRPHGYEMRKAIKNINPKTKELVDGIDRTYYGTIEQALVGFITHSIDCPETLDELKVKVMSIRDLIVDLKSEIVSQRGEIRRVKP